MSEINGTVQAKVTLMGSVTSRVEVHGSLATAVEIQGKATIPAMVDRDPYEGDYVINPRIESQEFETKAKRMTDNLTVNAIPYHEVSNVSGTTVIIGGL